MSILFVKILVGLGLSIILWSIGFLSVYYHKQILCWIKWNRSIPFDLRWKITYTWAESVKAGYARINRKMVVKQLSGFPAGENPFWHDSYHMGTYLGQNVLVMYSNFENDDMRYLIIIDKTTGERIRIDFSPVK